MRIGTIGPAAAPSRVTCKPHVHCACARQSRAQNKAMCPFMFVESRIAMARIPGGYARSGKKAETQVRAELAGPPGHYDGRPMAMEIECRTVDPF